MEKRYVKIKNIENDSEMMVDSRIASEFLGTGKFELVKEPKKEESKEIK